MIMIDFLRAIGLLNLELTLPLVISLSIAVFSIKGYKRGKKWYARKKRVAHEKS
jgi:hypothetical protein